MTFPETRAVEARYARRDGAADAQRYSLYANAAALQAQQERLRAMTRVWRAHGWSSLAGRSMLEVGCGSGGNLLDLLRLGATPEQLSGIELLPERANAARAALPNSVRILLDDACQCSISTGSQQAVLAFTLFSSLLDSNYRKHLARTLWQWVAPGGGVMVYDFTVNNPQNQDVRKLPLNELRSLFPDARLHSQRLTLAPPIARRLPAPVLGAAAVLMHPLRTHRLTWAIKSR
jgi:SAM-dependent methyltransferase